MTARELVREVVARLTDEQLKRVAWAGSTWVDMERYEDGGLARFRADLAAILESVVPR